MPYLQLDLEAKKMVPRVARALAVPDAQIGWGLMELWDWCWTEKRDRVSGLLLHGFFGAVVGELGATLEAFGFLEVCPEGFRVRGAEKYLRISEARSEAGKRRAGQAKRDAAGRLSSSKLPASAGEVASKSPATSQLLHPITQSPIHPTTTNPLTPFAGEAAPPPVGGQEALGLVVQEAKRPDPLDEAVGEVMSHYLKAMSAALKAVGMTHKKATDTPQGRNLIRDRLTGRKKLDTKKWTVFDCLQAINGLTWSDHHLLNGYHGIKYALRSSDQLATMLDRLPPEKRGAA